MRGGTIAVVVPRLVLGLAGDWRHTSVALPHGRWHDELGGDDHDGGNVSLAKLLARFPVGLLRRT